MEAQKKAFAQAARSGMVLHARGEESPPEMKTSPILPPTPVDVADKRLKARILLSSLEQ
jgi:hypothetical protein